ncbi:MAG: hypothetical protein NTV71_00760 [Candidatus Omnitrophica bacterium]|nr:hypothetical protein [Candidatus Omnitrophota bacterium]
MNRDALYFHFANLGLIIIGILSINKILGPIIAAFLILGVICGFLFSWHMKNSKLPHIDTFIGMLSLASVVIVMSKLYEIEINFENLLGVFSTALAWLSLFQSFGLKAQKSYGMIQFISVALLISSVSMALEQEISSVLYLIVFLFTLIFTMRLALVCEKQSLGSLIIGDRDDVMSLWNQIKIGAIMFSIILTLSSLLYPAVPRFNSLSLGWIPSSLLTLPGRVPLLKLMENSSKTIKHKKVKKEQLVNDNFLKRETNVNKPVEEKKEEETTERFQASEFKKEIDAYKVESLTINANKSETTLGQQVALDAVLKLADGSTLPATKLADWKTTGTAKVSIDKSGTLDFKKTGYIQVSATYMGAFSNELIIKATEPVEPKKKKGFLFYIFLFLLWIVFGAILIFLILVFIRLRRLIAMRRNNPKEFIKEVYYATCKAFKIYGLPKFNYISYREFYNIAKELIAKNPEPMQNLTESFLEASFSTHEISAEHTQKVIKLFHEVKEVILEREERNIFWKNTMFRLCVLDILLIPRSQIIDA